MKQRVDKIFDAVGDGDAAETKRLFVGTAAEDMMMPSLPVDLEDHEGNTPLSEAACYGEAELVSMLLDLGANIDAQNCQGRTPVWRATYNGHEDVVRLLLDKGADPTIASSSGEPPGKLGTPGTKALIAGWVPDMTSSARKRLSALQTLPRPWPNMLLAASKNGNSAEVDTILQAVQASHDILPETLVQTIIDFENVADALWTACCFGHSGLCRKMLEVKGNVNASNDSGLSCLMIACRKGHQEVVVELLQKRAKTYLLSDQGRLAIQYARDASKGGSTSGNELYGLLLAHCRKCEDWSSLEEEASRVAGNPICNTEGIKQDLGRPGAAASTAATSELLAMSTEEIKAGGDRYQQLLEQRALADVLGIG